MRPILVTTVLAATMSLGLAADLPDAQCPTSLPVPADATDIACIIASRGPSETCAVLISPSTCSALTENALNAGLVTVVGHDWLIAFGWCPIVFDIGTGPQIFGFCPLH